jgi:hypothetical protein
MKRGLAGHLILGLTGHMKNGLTRHLRGLRSVKPLPSQRRPRGIHATGSGSPCEKNEKHASAHRHRALPFPVERDPHPNQARIVLYSRLNPACNATSNQSHWLILATREKIRRFSSFLLTLGARLGDDVEVHVRLTNRGAFPSRCSSPRGHSRSRRAASDRESPRGRFNTKSLRSKRPRVCRFREFSKRRSRSKVS